MGLTPSTAPKKEKKGLMRKVFRRGSSKKDRAEAALAEERLGGAPGNSVPVQSAPLPAAPQGAPPGTDLPLRPGASFE